MHAIRFLAGAAVAVTAVSASAIDGDNVFAALLKRQEPGTPAYNCHDNCGQAIIEVRESGGDVCDSPSFLANYANCLQCAGPDNVGIWQYYGTTISAAAKECGLDTEPLDGEQDDVGAATPPGSGGSSPPSSSTSSSKPKPTDEETAAPKPTVPSKTTAAPEPTVSSETEEPEPTVPSETAESYGTSAEIPSATDDATGTGAPTAAPTGTGNGSAPTSGNGTESAAPTPSSPVQVDAAGSLRLGSAMGVFVAAAFGATIFA